MRVHSIACVYVLFFALRLPLTRGEMGCVAVCIGLVTAMEAINTAVEKLCDFTQERRDPKIRVIKDMAAGAVLLSALAAAGAGFAIFLRPELFALLRELCARPLSLALLALSLVASLVFILAGPRGIAKWFQKK